MRELYRTRPWRRVQPYTAGVTAAVYEVSILTRPWGRVQPKQVLTTVIEATFQSSPARGGGCNAHPPRARSQRSRVSILTRPWGRVQPSAWRLCWACNPIQSSPARGGGCNHRAGTGRARHLRRFNPHPPVGAGATSSRPAHSNRSARFNPHPPVGAGATICDAGAGCPLSPVSILTRPWGRVQQAALSSSVLDCSGVSILTRPWGRVQRARAATARRYTPRFNPHPPVGAGATSFPSRG